jgi:hypothetical protein
LGFNLDGTPMSSDWLDVCDKLYRVADLEGAGMDPYKMDYGTSVC